jgi:hypothetical protein
VCDFFYKHGTDVLIFFSPERVSVERSSAAESCWYTLHFLTFMLQLLLAMSMSIDYKLQTTQELGANPNVMSYKESSSELQMGPLHMALQFAPDPYRQECVSALLKHEMVRNLASEIHNN